MFEKCCKNQLNELQSFINEMVGVLSIIMNQVHVILPEKCQSSAKHIDTDKQNTTDHESACIVPGARRFKTNNAF